MVDTNQNGKFAHSLESEQATPQKGEIYWVDMPYYSTTVISNIRPCVVLSNNQANKNSKTILVTPITRRLKTSLSRRVNANSQQQLCLIWEHGKLIKKGEC